jgi:alpha-tubulin suppressor-like RCC1 family protein
MDNYGQLGDGGSNTNIFAPSSTAINLGTGRTAVSVSVGNGHTCAILDNGDLKCWGYDYYGQLGDGGSNTNQGSPVSLSGSNTWDSSTGSSSGSGSGSGGGSSTTSSFAYANNKVSAGNEHTCAILDNGDLKCWGDDQYGGLGDGGSNTDTNAPSSTAVDLGTGRTAVAVAGGTHHTCAILDNGDLKCWGWDNDGQLGDGGSTNTNTNTPSSTAINLGTGRTAVAV